MSPKVRSRRLLVRAILSGLVSALVAFTVTATAPDAAADEPDQVHIAIAGLTPLVPKTGDTLTVSGTATNTSADPVSGVTLDLRVSNYPLEYRAQMAEILAGSGARSGDVVKSSEPVTIQPGGKVNFSLAIPFEQLQLPGNGVYYLAVQANRPDGPLGTTVTFMPWFPAPTEVIPVQVVWLWPVSSPGARDAQGVVLSPDAGPAYGPDGRLSSLLDAGATKAADVTWAVDPQTTQEADVLSRAHRQLQAGTVTDAPGSDAAAQWLAKLRATTRGSDVAALPYSFPDAVTEVVQRLSPDLVLASTAAPRLLEAQLGAPVRGGLAWPLGGRLDQPTLNTLSAAGISQVVLSSDSVSGPDRDGSPFSQLRTDSGSVTAVIADPGLADSLAADSTAPGQPVLARQRFLAETAMLSLESPDTARTVVAVPPMFWQPDRAGLTQTLAATSVAPWSRLQPLRDALEAAGQPPAGTLTTQSGPGLTAAHMAVVKSASASLASVAAIMAAPGAELEGYRQALLRTESAAWVEDRATGALLVDRTFAQVLERQDQVRISPPGTVSFPGSTGRVPITIANDTEGPVTVGLVLTATPAYRMTTEPVTPVTIAAGRKVSLEVPVTLVGSGQLRVSAQLLTPQGSPYGRPTTVDLGTTAYSRAAAWVVGSAFLLLCLMIVVTFVRRRRQNFVERRMAREVAAETTATPDPGQQHGDPDETMEVPPPTAKGNDERS